jgi:hypothetical protein
MKEFIRLEDTDGDELVMTVRYSTNDSLYVGVTTYITPVEYRKADMILFKKDIPELIEYLQQFIEERK